MLSQLTYRFRSIPILVVLLVAMPGCGLKFGAKARQAAENSQVTENKNKKKNKSAGFVEVDNTKPDPKLVKRDESKSKPDKKVPKAEMVKEMAKAPKKPDSAARYIRVGKNRRLVTSVSKKFAKSQSPVKPKKDNPETHTNGKNNKPIKKNKETGQQLLYPTVQLFGAKIDQSQWLLSSTELECRLTQPIPRVGKAIFLFNPVQRLKFVYRVNHPIARKLSKRDKRYTQPLFTDKYPYPDVGAKLLSVPPNWKPFAVKKHLGYIPLTEGYTPFVLPHRKSIPTGQDEYKALSKGMKDGQQLASMSKDILPEIWPDRLMYELEEGMTIQLTYRDWTDGTQDIISGISSINFKQLKHKFESCIAKLPKYDFKKYKKTKLYFTKGQRRLSKKMRNQLRNMVKFIKLDESIKKVLIKSYTDSTGFKRVNREAAKVQAQAIKAYMRKLGMKAPITAIGIGEGPFVGSNRSAAGRAKNRRSIITLIK